MGDPWQGRVAVREGEAAMTCPKCGTELVSGARFCGGCGAVVEANARLPPAAAPARPRNEALMQTMLAPPSMNPLVNPAADPAPSPAPPAGPAAAPAGGAAAAHAPA